MSSEAHFIIPSFKVVIILDSPDKIITYLHQVTYPLSGKLVTVEAGGNIWQGYARQHAFYYDDTGLSRVDVYVSGKRDGE